MKTHPMKTRHYYQLYANDYDGSCGPTRLRKNASGVWAN